ncbi:MAG: catechol 1,2-dioxygenase [Acidobacteria bacterium]|nr:catechol 1,2-dioxygenase [Acidobacteriota bacterium]
MGEIVGAGLLAHVPTIVLPDDLRRELNNGRESTLFTGLHHLRDEVFNQLKPDVVLVFDSHWFTTVEFVVTAHERRAGHFTSDELPRGMSSVPYDFPGSPALAQLIARVAEDTEECWVTPIDNEHLSPTYATLNLLPFLQGDEKWVSLSVCQTADQRDFATVGRVVGQAIAQSDLRVALIASGAVSHTFHNLRNLRQHEAAGEEHIFSDAAREWDHRVIDALLEGRHAQVLSEMDQFLAVKPEGRFAHYQMMAAALGGPACRAPGRLFSEYENSIGTGQVHIWFDQPDRGWTGER